MKSRTQRDGEMVWCNFHPLHSRTIVNYGASERIRFWPALCHCSQHLSKRNEEDHKAVKNTTILRVDDVVHLGCDTVWTRGSIPTHGEIHCFHLQGKSNSIYDLLCITTQNIIIIAVRASTPTSSELNIKLRTSSIQSNTNYSTSTFGTGCCQLI
jgi:hypothetical protein